MMQYTYLIQNSFFQKSRVISGNQWKIFALFLLFPGAKSWETGPVGKLIPAFPALFQLPCQFKVYPIKRKNNTATFVLTVSLAYIRGNTFDMRYLCHEISQLILQVSVSSY
ncbi:Hypothetical_protein [Hexamita inflata]|uniref:Hypothetical_protein n=1 Tax=Hexamita inflata TaxID=28002 RepID=A0AA86RKM1_9EUKA|nr:Hypothetical protein HINF_LOCUS64243 [Hexamita inflata]